MPRSVLRLGSRKAETEKGLGSDVIFLLKALVKCLQVWCADSCGERWTGRDREWRLDVVGAVGGGQRGGIAAPLPTRKAVAASWWGRKVMEAPLPAVPLLAQA